MMPKKVPGNRSLITLTKNPIERSIAQYTCYDIVTLNIGLLASQKKHIDCLECFSKNILLSNSRSICTSDLNFMKPMENCSEAKNCVVEKKNMSPSITVIHNNAICDFWLRRWQH